ncbi:MAG: recombinase family protein, partial [Clostridia bacterium]|nr:recombinase family protein [Clostridia bacterium]
ASFVKIRRGLEADGILNGAKHARWHETNIKQILTNEKYIGDALLQKTYTVSVLDKKRSRNDGVMPKYYVEGCHEPIIDRETFLLVQEEIARRSSLYKGGKKRVYSSKYALSGNVVCGHCGNIYRRVVWYTGGEKPVVWRCVSRLTPGQECPARTVSEEDLHSAIASAVNMAYANRNEIIPVLKENIESVVGCNIDEEIEVIDNMIRKSQMDLLDAGKDEERIQEIGERIVSLRERRQNVLTQAALRKDEIDRIKAMISFIAEQTGEAEYSEALVRSMVEKVTIHDDKITVEFKSGLAIDVEA